MGNEKMPLSYWSEGVIVIFLWFAWPTSIIIAFNLPNSPMMQVELGLLSLFYGSGAFLDFGALVL